MMRYSEIPRDLSSDSLRFVELPEDQIYQTSSRKSPAVPPKNDRNKLTKNKEALPLIAERLKEPIYNKDDIYKSRPKKNSISSIGGGVAETATSHEYSNYSLNGISSQSKSQSLPPNASIQDIDNIIISALRLTPEELANQLTLLDYPIFAAIHPDELSNCEWTKKDKFVQAPNVVAFTKRFNHTSFWTVQEILGGGTAKERADIISHFIRVAKKLYELNNLNSLFAITSALKSASVYRLSKTWTCLSKKDKQTFDRLGDIFNEDNNWTNLREYLESLKLPCIPYLGLFLTDLVYIDLAHPHKGGLEPEQRQIKMNNILRVISNYQGSDYSHILPILRTQKYLNSVRYIEELQNLFEDDQYKKSLKLEPATNNIVQSSSSCSSKESVTPCNVETALASLNLSPAKSSSMRCANPAKFIPGHRKCRSLGSKFRSTSLPRNFHQCHCLSTILSGLTPNNRCHCRIFHKINCVTAASPLQQNESLHQSRHLLDDSVLEDSKQQQQLSDNGSSGSSDDVMGFETDGEPVINESYSIFQGCLRRKTVLKDRRKPAVASWQRYWVQIWSNSLVYFAPKSFKGMERSDYKREPCKVCSLEGWTAEAIEHSQSNTFQLTNMEMGTAYKFRTGSAEMSRQWLKAVRRISSTTEQHQRVPANLMSFE